MRNSISRKEERSLKVMRWYQIGMIDEEELALMSHYK